MACFRPTFRLSAKSLLLKARAPSLQGTRGISSLSTQFSLAESTNGGHKNFEKVKNLNVDTSPDKSRLKPTEEQNCIEKMKLSSISRAKTVEEVLHFLNTHENISLGETMDVLFKIRSLSFTQRKIDKNQMIFVKQLSDNPGLLQVWEKLEKKLPSINTNELYAVFQVYMLLKLPPNSRIFKKIIKLLLDNINHLPPLRVLSIYLSICDIHDPDISVRCLKLATLYYMDHSFDQNRRPNETYKAIIHFAQKRKIPLNIRRKLLDDIFSTDLTAFNDIKLLINVGQALTKRDIFNTYHKNANSIVRYCKIYRSSVDSSWDHKEIEMITKIDSLLVTSNRVKYDSDFYDRIAIMAVKNNFPTLTCINIAQHMISVPHLNDSILKKIINDIFVSDEKAPRTLSFFSMTNLLRVLGGVDFSTMKDINWNFYRKKLVSLLRNSLKVSEDQSRSLYVALNTAVMGIYENDLIEKAIDAVNREASLEETVQSSESDRVKSFFFEEWAILLLYQCLMLMHPTYDGPLLKNEILKTCWIKLENNLTLNHWSNVIDTVFGDNKYTLKRCTTHLYHVLSHVVILDENNTVVDVSEYEFLRGKESNYLEIEKIVLEPGHSFLLFVEFSSEARLDFRNVDKNIGLAVLYVRMLEAMGFNMVVLNSRTFYQLLDVERVPYLINEIERVCGPIRFPSRLSHQENGSEM